MSGLDSVGELYLYFGLIFGVGLSSVDVIALTTVARWFPLNRGFMTGITKVGTGAGQLVFPLMASTLIASYGWRNAYIVLGAVSLVLLSIIALLLRRKPEENKADKIILNRNEGISSGGSDLSLKQASGTSQLWMICLIYMLVVSCLMSVLIHIVPYCRDLDISSHRAAGVLSTIGGVSMLGRFFTGIVIDRIGSKRSMIFSLVVLVAGLSWLQTADNLWALYLFACVYGFAHGSFFTVISPILAEFFGTESHGAIFGMVLFFGTSGGAVGPIAAGYLFDVHGSYHYSFLLILLVCILGLIVSFLLKPVHQDSVK